MTKEEVLKEFRGRLAVKLLEAGIDYEWPAGDSLDVEVEGKHADQVGKLVRDVLDEWGRELASKM